MAVKLKLCSFTKIKTVSNITMTNMFQLSQSELHAFKNWSAKLEPLPGRAASYSFTFTPGAIGVTVTATRVEDGASVDLTDYTRW